MPKRKRLGCLNFEGRSRRVGSALRTCTRMENRDAADLYHQKGFLPANQKGLDLGIPLVNRAGVESTQLLNRDGREAPAGQRRSSQELCRAPRTTGESLPPYFIVTSLAQKKNFATSPQH